MDQACFSKEKQLMQAYEDILAKDGEFWHKKSGQKQIEVGDTNTKFFHNATKYRRVVNKVSQLKLQDDTVSEDPWIIIREMVNFFSNLLNKSKGSNLEAQQKMFCNIPSLVIEAQNKMLNDKLSSKEIKDALFQFHLNKVLSPYSFPTNFNQNCWDALREDLVEAIKNS